MATNNQVQGLTWEKRERNVSWVMMIKLTEEPPTSKSKDYRMSHIIAKWTRKKKKME